MLVILTVDGYVNLWEYDNKEKSPPRLLSWEKLSIDRNERTNNSTLEKFVAIAVCPRNTHVAVSSSTGVDETISRLFWLKIDKKM